MKIPYADGLGQSAVEVKNEMLGRLGKPTHRKDSSEDPPFGPLSLYVRRFPTGATTSGLHVSF